MADLWDESLFQPYRLWGPREVLSASVSADNGRFKMMGDLCERIQSRDLHYQGVLGNRIMPLLTMPFQDPVWSEVQPDTGLTLWRSCLSIAHEIQIRIDLLQQGFALVEMTAWGEGFPRIIRHNIRSLTYDGKDWVSTRKDLSKFKLEFPQFAIITGQVDDRPWAYGSYNAIALWHLLKCIAHEDWGYYSQKTGNIIIGLTGVESTRERESAVTKLEGLGKGIVLGFKQGADLKFFEAQAKTWETFQAQIEAANQEISVGTLGANLSTIASAGTGAVAEVHANQQSIRWLFDNELFANQIYEKCFVPFSGYRLSVPLRDVSNVEDERNLAAARQSAGQAIAAYIGAGFKLTEQDAKGMMYL
jgi:hypothetical protein